MTIGGALSVLNDLLNADDIPFFYKPSIKAVMDVVASGSLEIPTDSNIKMDLAVFKHLLSADDIPFYYKPSIKAVMDTIILSGSEIPISLTKNDLGVECRSLEDIKKLVERKANELDGVMLDAGGVIIGLYFAIANDLPSVTPQPKTGHWIYKNFNWWCSECNETPKTMGYVGTADFMTEHFKFCNHCGAKMGGATKK